MDIKTLIRQLEDQEEINNLLKFEKEVSSRERGRLKEMVEAEAHHNARLKQLLQQINDLNAAETKKRNSVAAIRFKFMRGTLTQLLYFSEGQVEQIKRALHTKKANLVNKLNAYIEDFAKTRPLAIEFHQKNTLLDRLQYEKSHLVAELKTIRKALNDETQIAEILFQQNVLEMAAHVLRYNDIVNGIKNPSKSTRSKLMAMKAMRQSLKPSSSVSEPSRTESNSEMMPPTTSKCQSIDTNEVAGTEAFVRLSASRTAVRVKKTDGNEKRRGVDLINKPQMSRKPPTAQSFNATHVRDEIKGKATPEQAKKVVPPNQSKKSERPEQFKKIVLTKPEQTVSIAPQEQRKNISPPEQSKKVTSPAQSKKNVSVPSSLKATTDSVNSSQKSKLANVTFSDFPPPGSSFEANFSQGREVSSSGFDLPELDTHISLEDDEMDRQMTDDDAGMDPQMDDDAEMDPQMDDDDAEMDPQMDDDAEMDAQLDGDGNDSDNRPFDDNISEWSSLDPSSGNNANIASPDMSEATSDRSDLDSAFFNRGDADAEPLGDDNFAGLEGDLGGAFQMSEGDNGGGFQMNEDNLGDGFPMSEMGEFFKNL